MQRAGRKNKKIVTWFHSIKYTAYFQWFPTKNFFQTTWTSWERKEKDRRIVLTLRSLPNLRFWDSRENGPQCQAQNRCSTFIQQKFPELLTVNTLLDTKNKRCLNDLLNAFLQSKWEFNLFLYIFYVFCIFFLQANLRRLDFTGNLIEDIEDSTFSKLSLLEELTLAENQLLKLPVLPPKLTLFNAKYNKIKSRGIKANTFKVSIL